MMRTILLVLLAWMVVTPAAAETVLRLATVAPDGSFWMREMRAGAEEIARRTEGRVRIQYFPGGVMGNERAVMRRIRIGQLQGGAFTGGSLTYLYPDSSIYSLPLLFRSYEEVDYVRERVDPLLMRGIERHGFESFGIAEGGFARLLSSVPVATVEDLAGQKVWVPEGDPVAYEAMSALGLTPITLPLTDVLTGLQTGLINIIASPPIGAVAFQWHTRVRYMTATPLAYTWAQMIIDKRALARLDDADRAVVGEVMRATYRTLDGKNREDNRAAIEAMQRQGIEVVTPDEQELEEWHAVAERVTQALVERGIYTEDMYDVIRAHLDRHRAENP